MAAETHNEWYVNAVAGGISSCVSKTIMTPFQRVITLRQLGRKGDVPTLVKEILAEERKGLAEEAPLQMRHLKGFWRGNLMSMCHRFPYSAVQLAFYERFRNLLTHTFKVGDNDESSKFKVKAVAAGVAAGVSGTVAYPLDVMKTRLQTGNEHTRTWAAAARTIYGELGMYGFFSGITTNLMKTVPEITINLTTYETVKFTMIDRKYDESVAVSCGGVAAALIAVACCYPLETVKKRVAAGKSGEIHYAGPADCFARVMKEEGIKGFYKGAGLECCRAVPQVLLMWHLVEYVRGVCREKLRTVL